MLEKNDLVNKFLEKALKYNQNHNLFNRNNKKERNRNRTRTVIFAKAIVFDIKSIILETND